MLYANLTVIGSDKSDLPGIHRVVLHDEEQDIVWLLKVDSDQSNQRNNYLKKPKKFPKEKLEKMLKNEEIKETTINMPEIFYLDDNEIIKRGKKSWIIERDKRYEIINNLCMSSYEEMITGPYSKECTNKTKHLPYSHREIVRFFHRYIAFDKNKQALIPYRYFQGGRGKNKSITLDKNNEEIKRGRPHNDVRNKKTKKHGINISKEIILEIILANKKHPKQYAKGHKYIQNKVFNNGFMIDSSGVKIPILKPESETIKYGQYYYHAKNNEEYNQTEKQLLTVSEYYNTTRPKIGRSHDNIYTPAQCYQVDAWRAPIELVSSFDRTKRIGLAIVYVAIDVFSHMYVGLYVDIIEPSWEAIRQLYYNTFTNKVDFCSKYGITIKKEEWDAEFVPYSVLLDRGSEMIARLKREGIFYAGVKDAKTTPPRFAAAKGLVESCFNRLRKALKNVPGSFDKGCDSRKRKYASLNAKLTVDDLTELLIEEILHLNSYAKKRQLLTPAMNKDKVLPYPKDIWEWGCKNRLVKGNKKPEKELRIDLLHPGEAKVTDHGIEFNKLVYDSDELRKEGWFFKARNNTWRVKIRYSTIDANFIFVYDTNMKSYECHLQKSYKEFKNRNFIDIKIYQEDENNRLSSSKHKDKENQAEAKKTSLQEQIVRNAKKKTDEAERKKTKEVSKSKKLASKGKNRKEEKKFRSLTRAQEDAKILNTEPKENNKQKNISKRTRDYQELYGDDENE